MPIKPPQALYPPRRQEVPRRERQDIPVRPRHLPRVEGIDTAAQVMIQRLISVSADTSVRLATDLNLDEWITTFVVQNLSTNPFPVFLFEAAAQVTRPLAPFAAHEILPGMAPVFQIASQMSATTVCCWDLTNYWLIGAEGFTGQTENVVLTAYPLTYTA